MLTKEEIDEHLSVLRITFDPSSPFYGLVNFEEGEGLLSLPPQEQQQILDAAPPELRRMMFSQPPKGEGRLTKY